MLHLTSLAVGTIRGAEIKRLGVMSMAKSKPAKLCKAGTKLRDQVNKAYPNRDKASDGWIGDLRHKKTKSDHNPDKDGIVRALDLDSDFAKSVKAQDVADEIVKAAKNGDNRISYVIYNKKIASPKNKWVWRPYVGTNPHTSHIHVSFTLAGDNDGKKFAINLPEPRRIKMAAVKKPNKPIISKPIPAGSIVLAYAKLATLKAKRDKLNRQIIELQAKYNIK